MMCARERVKGGGHDGGVWKEGLNIQIQNTEFRIPN